ncbi:MAG: hypothetical protein ACREJP_03635, partial [Candidatus Methylomirabilales bacterium]
MIEEMRQRIARRLAEYRIPKGDGEAGSLTFGLRQGVSRTFRAHWTGFKLFSPGPTVVLRAELADGSFWSEGYISDSQPSWVLAFRRRPPPARGSGGPRPDDKLALESAVQVALSHRRHLIEAGRIPDEELIRMEDFDDPLEAIDEFFNYTAWYALRAVEASWSQLGYVPDPSIDWGKDEEQVASLPVEAAVEEALKKSDIIWVTPNTSDRPIPCWFAAREGRIYVLSGERQQLIPDAARVREAAVAARWKGRDARLVDFSASVRPITAENAGEFRRLAELLLAKRQSVTGSAEENIVR